MLGLGCESAKDFLQEQIIVTVQCCILATTLLCLLFSFLASKLKL